jgi:hypothetical protein
MKLLLISSLVLTGFFTQAQSPDYISVRKKTGRVVKNFYTGSRITVQTKDGGYWEGPISAIRNDSIFLTIYDIRFYPTVFGTRMRDTAAVLPLGLSYNDLARVYLSVRQSFWQRSLPSLMMVGGAGYLSLNVLNGALFSLPLTDEKNLRKIGISAGALAAGFFLSKLFHSDGFSTSRHRLLYVKLSADPSQ